MSREIKFRAFDNGQHHYAVGYSPVQGYWYYLDDYDEIEVEDEQIERFTGFTDESNTPMYQGDIVVDDYNRKMLVVFREHKQTLEFKALTETNFKYALIQGWCNNQDGSAGDMTARVRVVGNSRQHKHLLEN